MKSLNGTEVALEGTGFEARILSGECRTSATQLVQEAGVRCGVWECTPGSWESSWATWEIFTVLAGVGTLTDGDGLVHVLTPGAVVHIPEGSVGVWDVSETIRKSYVAPAKLPLN